MTNVLCWRSHYLSLLLQILDSCILLTNIITLETTIRNLHVVSREEMQPSRPSTRIRPNTPSLRHWRRTTPLFDDRSSQPRPASLVSLLWEEDVEVNPEPVYTECTIRSSAPIANVSSMGIATA